MSFLAKEDKTAVAKSIASILAIGGLSSIPFFKTIESFLQSETGVNIRSYIAEQLEDNDMEKTKDLLFYGAAGIAGVDIGGSMGIEVPGYREVGTGSLKEILGQGAIDILGVPTSIGSDFFSSMEQLYHGDFYRTLEEAPFTPAMFENWLVGQRMQTEGATTKTGTPILDREGEQVKLTDAEAFKKKYLGFQPMSTSERNRVYQAEQGELARYDKIKDDLKTRYKKAIVKYGMDSEEAGKVGNQIMEFNTTKPLHISTINMSALLREMMGNVTPQQFLLQQEIR
jgi:hypothetical protein